MKHALAVLLTAAVAVAAVAEQGPPLTPEQQQQISKMPVMPEDRRVQTQNIDSVMSLGELSFSTSVSRRRLRSWVDTRARSTSR
jgi:hypothetical protein